MRLVFVHGIGGPRESDAELAVWTDALADGADRAGHPRFAKDLADRSIDVVFANYSDLFGAEGAQGGAEGETDEVAAALTVELFRQLLEDHLAADPGPAEREALTHALEQVAPQGAAQGLGAVLRRTVNAATTLLGAPAFGPVGRWVAGRFLVADLAQVGRYLARGDLDLHRGTLDQRIRARVVERLGDGPVVVVAHSLGSVVAYETLHAHPVPAPLLVTIGSPLALRSVVLPRILPRPPRTPDCVGRWCNFWDRDDVVVARPQLDADFPPNAAGAAPVTDRIDSDGIWVHTATKYLAKAAVAGPVAAAFASRAAG
jgi:pimeloyl-ACP methyl ester carboxylesterase